MPRGDGTGPMGMGPRSGRAAGYCAGFAVPGYANPGFAQNFRSGMGRGMRGGGRGWRNMYYATAMPGWMRSGYAPSYGAPGATMNADPEMEKQALKNQADALQAELDAVKKRLDEMETTAE